MSSSSGTDPGRALLTDEQFAARTAELLAQESGQPMCWWWLSFAGQDGFRGVAIVEARGILGAVQRSRVLGINPGGEVQAFRYPAGAAPAVEFQNRLITDPIEAQRLAQETP